MVPFPNDKRALRLRSVQDILKEDVSGAVAEEKFEAVKDNVQRQLNVWRRSIAEKLRMKLEASSDYSSLLAPITWRRKHSPPPPGEFGSACWLVNNITNLVLVVISTQFTEESQPYIQGHDIRKILRADSVFQIGTDQACWFFPDVVEFMQDTLPVPEPNYGSEDEDEESGWGYYNRRYELPHVLDLSRVHRHSPGQRTAECLLACLGKPDAAYLEMKALGRRFVCGRCWVKTPMTWTEMVSHGRISR